MNSILIFRTHLLRPSETFIRSQAEAMSRFQPYFVGWRKVNGLQVPSDSCWVANTGGLLGRIQEFRFRFRGPGSSCLSSLRKTRPRLVHAHFGPDACEAMPLASQLGLPLVVTFHGYDATVDDVGLQRGRFGSKFVGLRPQLQAQGALFIAVSEFIRKRLLKLGFPRERIVVHYIGVDTEAFRPNESVERLPVVLFVARLVEKKGCSFLLKAMALVRVVVPNVELVIIGDGPESQQLKREADTLLPGVQFLGAQPPHVVKQWMQRAAVFCVPSITATNGDSEGFGLVFAEAQACGTPVVSFSSGGIPEAVAHGEAGFLACEGDSRMLADYILLLLTNKELWREFSQSGRRRMLTYFDLKKQTARLEEIYDRVIASAPDRDPCEGRE